jgi:hypothetical protein
MPAARLARTARRGFLLAIAAAAVVTIFVAVAPGTVHAAATACIQPRFVDGLAQAVFPAGTANYSNEQVLGRGALRQRLRRESRLHQIPALLGG